MLKKIIEKDDIPIVEPSENGFYYIYKDGHKEFHPNKYKDMLQWKSKETLEKERPQYALLPADDYELIVSEAKEETRPKYMKPSETEDIVNVKLAVVAFKDGSEAVDIEGKPAKDRMVFFTIRPNSMGFMKDGTPAKSRSFIAYAMGQEINGDIKIEAWEQLLGKTIYAEIVQYETGKGEKRNKISRILPPPRNKKSK